MPTPDPLKHVRPERLVDVPRRAAKPRRVPHEDFTVPGLGHAAWIPANDYNVAQLRETCAFHGLRRTGNKHELRARCYNYIRVASAVVVLQSAYRGHLHRRVARLRGPGFIDRTACTNSTELASLCSVGDIPWYMYVGYKQGAITWGFDVETAARLVRDACGTPRNPYNRSCLPVAFTSRVSEVRRLSKMLGYPDTVPDDPPLSDGGQAPTAAAQRDPVLRCHQLFAHLERSTGTLLDERWLSALDERDLLKLYRELYDVWHHRAGLDRQARVDMVPPHGQPFVDMEWSALVAGGRAVAYEAMLTICERTSGARTVTGGLPANADGPCGAHYVLVALALVSPAAGEALPWLAWAGGQTTA